MYEDEFDDAYYDPYYDVPTKDERTWAMLCHLSALSIYIGIPFGNILGPLIIWLVKRDESPFIDAHGKAALNFHTSLAIYALVAVFFSIFLIGIPFLIAIIFAGMVFSIVAAVRANDGRYYRYPMSIQFLR